jgi:hypothetical protein
LQNERKKEERNKEKETGRNKQGNTEINGYERKKKVETERKKKERMKLYVSAISTCIEMQNSNSASNMPRGIQRF